MSRVICIAPAATLHYPAGGGHVWVYLNWAIGLRALGFQVIWLEQVKRGTTAEVLQKQIDKLKSRLRPYGFADSIALYSATGAILPSEAAAGCLNLERATAAELLIDMYSTPADVVRRFKRSIFIDTDPGIVQTIVALADSKLVAHDLYFSISETVGCAGALIPDLGLQWHYTPPCVALDHWKPTRAALDAPFTTVVHWWAGAGLLEDNPEDKRTAFRPFLDLPQRTSQSLELATDFSENDPEYEILRKHGWGVRNAHEVSSTPWDYQTYLGCSRGEFSCAKPTYVRLQTAWVSDRSVCYLASGKPVVVQHTGPSRYLPDAEGMFRFTTIEEAVSALQEISSDYDRHSCAARALAEEQFDAKKVASALLEKALV